MPLYRIGQAWIPYTTKPRNSCFLLPAHRRTTEPSNKFLPPSLNPLNAGKYQYATPLPLPRVSSPTRKITLVNIYIYILTLNRSWRVFVEKLLEPVAAGRASFRSIAYALYKPTKRFYLFFLSPPSRASFVSTNRQRSPLFIYTAAADVSLLLPICPVYTRIIHVYVSPAARARPFRTPVRRNRGQHALVSTPPSFTRCTPTDISRANLSARTSSLHAS